MGSPLILRFPMRCNEGRGGPLRPSIGGTSRNGPGEGPRARLKAGCLRLTRESLVEHSRDNPFHQSRCDDPRSNHTQGLTGRNYGPKGTEVDGRKGSPSTSRVDSFTTRTKS